MPSSPIDRRLDDALRASSSYQELSPDRRAQLRSDLHRVLGVITEDVPRAVAFDSSTPATNVPPALGTSISGQPSQKGADAVAALDKSIDFKDFVKALISNVYNAIVHSSIEQMEAYSKLLESVVQPVEEFAKDTISDSSANGFLAGMMPSHFSMAPGGGLTTKAGGDPSSAVMSQFPSLGSLDFNDPTHMQQLTNEAKLQMARQRQQLLATMVMMGINRIVVTDGEINATMSIDVNTDEALAQTAMSQDGSQSLTEFGISGTAKNGGLPLAASGSVGLIRVSNRATVDQNTSDARLQAIADLTGSVNIKFKSETMPLDRFADPLSKILLDNKAKPKTPAGGGASPTPPAPAPAPAPASESQAYGGRGGARFRGSRGTAGGPWPRVVVIGAR